jgi:hypothetical protein
VGAPAGASNIVPDALSSAPLRYVLPLAGIVVATAAGLLVRRGRRDASETAGFDLALAAAPLVATSVWYTYLVMALPALLRHPDRHADGRPSRRGWPSRALAWLAIEARVSPLPIAGLVGLLLSALADLVRAPREASGGRE